MAANKGADAYIAELKARWGYQATWLPGTTVNPGDVGRLNKQKLVIETDLAALGIRFTVSESQAENEYQFSSQTVSVEAKATAQVTLGPAPTTTLRAEFRSAGGFLFAAYDCAAHRVQRIDALAKEVLRLDEKGDWHPDWFIVTEVIAAGSVITLISESAGAFAEIETRANIVAGSMPIVGLRGAIRLGAHKGLDCKMVSRGHVTPMFLAHGLTGRRRRQPQLDPRGAISAPDSSEPLDLRQVLP